VPEGEKRVRTGTDGNVTAGPRTPPPQGKQREKPPVRDVPEGYGRYRYDRCDRYLGRGPDHGRTARYRGGPRTADIARSFRCSMT